MTASVGSGAAHHAGAIAALTTLAMAADRPA